MATRIRMLSANLRNGGASPEALALLLSDLQVDLAAFQELGPEQAEAIAEVMPHGSLEPDPVFGGMGLALRRPGEVTHVHLPHRNAHRVELTPDTWPDLPVGIEVINVHITAPHQFPPWRALRERQQQVRGLLAHVFDPPDRRQVLLGDLNATPLWPVYRRLRSVGIDAAALAAQRRGAPPARTWGPWPGAPRLLRIDHVFVSGLEVESFQVRRVPGSDHSAVVVDLSVG